LSASSATLFFDLDHTIMRNMFASSVLPVAYEEIHRETGVPKADVQALVVREHNRRLNSACAPYPRVMDWDDIVQEVACSLGCSLSCSLEHLVRRFCLPPHIRALDDAANILLTLKESGRRRMVVSSMGLSCYQVPVLKALGLYDLFDDFLMPDITGHLKWHREHYARCTDKASDKHVFISIGDMYRDDVLPAKSFGFSSVLKARVPALAGFAAMERPRHLHTVRNELRGSPASLPFLPDAVISDLAELLTVIPALEARHTARA
jgi:FMN phosphatase YigB (HAD superfamily)